MRSLIAVVLLSISSRTHWRGGASIKVSRTFLLRSVVLAVVSGYLLLLGVLGEGMRYLGPQLPQLLMLSLGFFLGVALLPVLLSERLKRELKVFLHKNFHLSKYDYRAQWLDLTEGLASIESGEELLKRVLFAYCDIFGVKGGALFQHREGCGWFCAAAIREMEEIKEKIEDDNLLVAYLRQRHWVFSSRDHNPGILAQNAALIERHRISFVVPLFESETLIGFVVLGEQVVSGEQYRYEDFDLMKTIARQASVAIQHQRLSEQLTHAKAVQAVGNLATFVLHDLKNLAATISLIVENAEQHIENHEFQKDLLANLGATAKKMHGLIGRLRNLGESGLFEIRPADLLALVQRSAELVQGETIVVQGTPETALVDEEELQKVLVNLFMNAVEASSSGARITAEVGFAGMPFVRVSDKGCGMSASFIRSELFAPFRSTKRSGLGIGMYHCRQIVAAHGGRIDVASIEGSGTVFTVWLPGPADGAAGITQAA